MRDEGRLSGETVGARLARWWRRQARRRFGPVEVAFAVIAVLAVTGAVVAVRQRAIERRARVIAVLPMRNTSPDVEGSAHLGEALGEELIRRLGSSRAVRLLPWVTTSRFSELPDTLSEFARRLHADLLLTGTYREDDGLLLIQASLIEGRTGTQIWSERFQAPTSQLIRLQSDIAAEVTRRVALGLTREQRGRLEASAPADPAAYEYYLRGANAWHSPDAATQALAEPFFRQAVALDPRLAEAWVGLGAVHIERYYLGGDRGYANLDSAEAHFHRALAIRPELPAAERGLIRLYSERNRIFPGQNELALDVAVHALERDPEDLEQLQTAAWGLFNGLQMRLAVPVLEHAMKLDPNHQPMAYYRVMSLYYAMFPQRCIEAGTSYVRAFGEDVDVYMGRSAQALGRPREAVVLMERACQILAPDSYHDCESELMNAYREVGDRERFERQRDRVVDELELRYAANPDNFRIADNLLSVYQEVGDLRGFERHLKSVHASLERAWIRVRELDATLRRGDSGMLQSYSLIHAARQGRMQEAERLMNSIAPNDDSAWSLLDWKPAEGDPAWQALTRHPGFLALRNRLSAARDLRFEKYRAVVARLLPTEPEVPGPQSRPSVAPVEL